MVIVPTQLTFTDGTNLQEVSYVVNNGTTTQGYFTVDTANNSLDLPDSTSSFFFLRNKSIKN